MDVNNIKTWLKKHSDNISALDRNMHHDSEFISMLMNNLSVKIESSHAQHSEAIGALGQENEQLLSGNFIYFYLQKKELKFFIYSFLFLMCFSFQMLNQ